MLQTFKMLLGLDPDEESYLLDDKLAWILESVKSRLKLLLGGIDPPGEMEQIIIEVAIIRYNRIGSEGLEAHNVAGENQQFHDNDFDGYMNEIQAFLDLQKDAKRGRVRFL